MSRTIILVLFLSLFSSGAICQQQPQNLEGVYDCVYSAKSTFDLINRIFNEETSQAVIKDIVKLTNSIPGLMDKCGDSEDAQSYIQQLPEKCVNDMGEAAKVILRLINETDNKPIFSLDLLLLKVLYDKKLQNECPFFANTTVTDIKDPQSCISAVSKLDDLYDDLVEAYNKSKYNQTVDFLTEILDHIPKTLDSCGQSDMAQTVREDLPERCLKSLNKFGKLVASYEECTSGIEWLFTHIFELYERFYEVEYTCPIFDSNSLNKIPTKTFLKFIQDKKFQDILRTLKQKIEEIDE